MKRPRFPITVDDWRALCAELAATPERLQQARLDAERCRASGKTRDYQRHRTYIHNHLGPYPFAPIVECREGLTEWLELNEELDHARMPLVALLSSPTGSGKTTLVKHLLAPLDRQRLEERGELTDEGHRRIPVMLLTLTESSGLAAVCDRGFEWAFEPVSTQAKVDRSARRLVKLCLACEVEVLVLDDADNLSFHPKHLPFLKDLLNQLPISLLLIGVDLHQRGPTAARDSRSVRWLEQLGTRTLDYAIDRPDVATETGRARWSSLVKRVSGDLVLPHTAIALTDRHSLSYLDGRCGGQIEELTRTLRRAAMKLAKEELDRGQTPALDVAFLHTNVKPTTQIKVAEALAWSAYETARADHAVPAH